MDDLALLIFLGAIVVIVLNVCIANVFKQIAEMKGHMESSRYFWWSFLFGPVGWAMVIALPDRNQTPVVVQQHEPETTAEELKEELPDL